MSALLILLAREAALNAAWEAHCAGRAMTWLEL